MSGPYPPNRYEPNFHGMSVVEMERQVRQKYAEEQQAAKASAAKAKRAKILLLTKGN